MGVTVLQTYNVLEGKTGPQTIDFLTKRLLALGAVHSGQFLVDCETHIYTSQHGMGLMGIFIVKMCEKWLKTAA